MFFLQMAGFPGAGKSTLAKEIAKQTGCIIVDHDISKTSLLKSFQELQWTQDIAAKWLMIWIFHSLIIIWDKGEVLS